MSAAADTAPASLPSSGSLDAGGIMVRAAYYAFVLWIPIETIDLFGLGTDSKVINFSRLLGLLLFLLAVMERRRCFRTIPAAFWPVAWYISAYSASQLWVPRELDQLFVSKQVILIYGAVIFLISANLLADARFRGRVLRFYGWWASLVAVGMLLGVFGDVYRGEEGRDSIFGQDPNVAAGFYASGAICIAGDPGLFAPKGRFVRCLAALLAIVGLIIAIIQTGSRGGLAVFVAGIVGLAVCGGRATRTKRVWIAVAALGALTVLIVREFQNNTIAAGRLMNAWTLGDTAGRGEIYDESWRMFLERPLLGYGGANNVAALGITLKNVSGGIFYRDTHNLALAVLTEVGLVGAVPFLAAILCILWMAWRYGRRTGDAVPFALMCAQIVINSSLTGANQNLFWIVLAAAVACGADQT